MFKLIADHKSVQATKRIFNRSQFPFSTLVSNKTFDLFAYPYGCTVPLLGLLYVSIHKMQNT